jgi:hypothetical protein
MHVQDLKRWHWIAISLVVGLALSYVWSSVEWDENLPTIGQRDFEDGLTVPYPQARHLSNITVMPPQEGKYKIVAEQVRNTREAGVIDLRPVAYMADTPYKAGQYRGMDEQHDTVLKYLETAKASNAEIKYKYAWYRETWAIYLLWCGASVLLIGGVWPSVVSLMVGAGLGFHKEDQGPDYDLNRFKHEEEAKKKGGTAATASAADLQHLHELEDELEKKLAAQRAGLPIPEDEQAAQAGVRKLDGGTLQSLAPDKPPEDHEYKGEFYPVDRGAKKKDH